MLTLGNINGHRIEHHVKMILDDTFPLLLALDCEQGVDKLPSEWLEEVANLMVGLINQLADAQSEQTAEGNATG